MSPTEIEAKLARGTADLGAIVRVHFDGACQPPAGPGIATYGFTVEGAGLTSEGKGLAVAPWSPRATNNVAEYVAAIRALEWLRAQHYDGPVLMLGDSQLVIRQMQGEYAVRAEHLRPYHERLSSLTGAFSEVRFVWVAREENSRADALSKEALAEAREEARRHRPTHSERRAEDATPTSGSSYVSDYRQRTV